MNRTNRTLLPLVCALVLVLIPLYYSWGQATTPSSQQDQTDRNGVNQNQDLNHDTNMPNQNSSPDQNSSDVNQSDTNQTTDHNMKSSDQSIEQEKPSSTPEATSEQDQNQKQNDKTESQDQDRKGTDTDQNTAHKPGMPRTAGELPLLALIGTLSLVAAAGTQLFTRGQ